MKSKVTKEQQLKELTSRIPPVLNVNIVVMKDGEYLTGKRNKKPEVGTWLLPGSRMKFTETPQETAKRVLKHEIPGVKASLKKFITVVSDKGLDIRANGVALYYLFEYESGKPKPNSNVSQFKWVNNKKLLKLKKASWLDQSIVNEIDIAIRTMNTTEDEIIVEVDKNDKEIGTIIKRVAHSTKKRFHRGAHIMIFNSKGQVLLQQRSFIKSHGPGRWDMPGGHQAAGQTIEQCAYAELAEEMGIRTDLTLKRVGLFELDEQSEYFYLYYGIDDGPYGFDRNEVEQIQAFDCQKLIDGKYKDYDIFDHVVNYTKELDFVWKPLVKK